MEITLSASKENFSSALQFVEYGVKCCDRNYTKIFLTELRIITEEIFTNIASYAYQDDSGNERCGTVKIKLDFAANGIFLIFADNGKAFDPLALNDPDTSQEAILARTDIGGFGVFLAKKFSTSIKYDRVGSENVLTIFKEWGND
jgi:anti-sigma regulatory factor (Ser/Thr protein kinase)